MFTDIILRLYNLAYKLIESVLNNCLLYYPVINRLRSLLQTRAISGSLGRVDHFKAKFHYASWFGAGSKLVRTR